MNFNSLKTKLFLSFAMFFLAFPLLGSGKNTDKRIKSKKQVVMEGMRDVPQISVEKLKAKMDGKKKFVLIDVRTERERNAGYISGSVWLPKGVLEFRVQSVCKDADTEIVVYCRKGGRSMLGVKALKQLGYKNVYNLEGGINAWGEKGYSLYNWHGEIKVVKFDKKDPHHSSYDIFKK